MPTNPGYVSNATLANRLSALVDRWDTREDQINALFTQPTGTVPFTDAAGNTTYLPSHTALFTSVQNALDDLAGAYAGAEAYANASNNSAILASQWAENNEDVPVSTGLFSAKHWAMKAAASAAAVTTLDPDLTAIAGLAGNSGFLKKTGVNTWTLDTSTYLTSVPAQSYASLTGKPTTLSGYGITDAQPLDADLSAIAALAGAVGFLKKTALNTWALDTNTYLTSVPAQTWASITGKPTTLSGYGITDAYSSSNPSNYITLASVTWSNLASKPTTLAGYGITDAQALDADLTAIAALAGTTGFLKKTALNTWTLDTSVYLTSVPAQTWASITGKPTTIAGYGITDAYTKTEMDTALSGKQASLGFTPYNATNPSGYITVSSVTWSNLSGKPTTISGYGITDAVTNNSTQSIAGTKTFTDNAVFSKGGAGVAFKAGATADHVYLEFYADSQDQATRSGYFGFPGVGSTNMAYANQMVNGNIDFMTNGTGIVKVNGYQVLNSNNFSTWAQPLLSSGSNIKTINGISLLGSGDIVISGGGGGGTWGSITGTLSSQTDLQTALDGKQAALGFTPYNATNPAGYITVASVTWTNLSGKPTTLAGYGITDAYSSSNPAGYITVSSVTWTNLGGKPTTLAGYGITDAQALDADLTAIAGLAGTTGLLRKTAANTWSLDTSVYLTSVPAQTWASITGKPTTISGYGITDAYTKTEVDTALGGKQSTLVSATNIKTINGNSILGSGDLVISGGGGGAATEIDDLNSASNIKFWTGTQAQYDAIGTKDAATTYRITDAVEVPSLTNVAAALSADVAMATTNTWYDGPSISLPAGTWLVTAHISFWRTATTATIWFGRISTGTVHYASSQMYTPSVAGVGGTVALTSIVTVAATTTVKVQGTTSAGAAACLMKAATTANGSGNNATRIQAIRIA